MTSKLHCNSCGCELHQGMPTKQMYDKACDALDKANERADKAEKELSELKERTRWIPVSERLPELNEHGFPPDVLSIDEE